MSMWLAHVVRVLWKTRDDSENMFRLIESNNNKLIYIAQYTTNIACSTRLYVCIYKTKNHDDKLQS